MEIAQEAQHRFERKVSWGLAVGERRELWTHVSAPVMTRLRQPQRLVLDTLVDAAWPGRARTRWPGASDWSGSTRTTGSRAPRGMTAVADVRAKGPAA